MRALRDGRRPPFDQHAPPADGGRPTTDAVIGGAEVAVEEPGLRVISLADIDEIGIAVVRSEAGGSPPPPRRRRGGVACFYVLEGELVLSAGDREVRAGAGSWLQIADDVSHGISSPGPERVVLERYA